MTLTLDSLLATHKVEAPAPAPVPAAPVAAAGFTRGRPAAAAPARLRSEPQAKFLKALLAERVGVEAAEEIRATLNAEREAGGVTSATASASIKALLAIPKAEAPAKVEEAPEGPAVWPGIYTVETPERHFTFRVEVMASDAEFAPGKTILSVLTGQNNTSDYTSIAFIVGTEAKVWKSRLAQVSEGMRVAIHTLLSDPDSVLTAKHCLRCNEVLTVPASVAAGYGPVCIKKGPR